MKRVLLFVSLSFFALDLFSQIPGINYQAVLRNGLELVSEKSVLVRITLTDGSDDGPVLYQEDHTIITDAFGYINFMIGEGTTQDGAMENLTGKADIFVKIEADIDNQGSMLNFGSSKLGAVHYALYGKDEDADPDNELQTLSLNGDMLSLSQGDSVALTGLISPWKTENNGRSYQLTLNSQPLTREKDNHTGVTIEGDEEGGITQTYEIGDGQHQQEQRKKTKYDDLPDRVKQGLDSLKAKNDKIPDVSGCDFNTIIKKTDGKTDERRYTKEKGDTTIIIRFLNGDKTVEIDENVMDKLNIRGQATFFSDDLIFFSFPPVKKSDEGDKVSKEDIHQYNGRTLNQTEEIIFTDQDEVIINHTYASNALSASTGTTGLVLVKNVNQETFSIGDLGSTNAFNFDLNNNSLKGESGNDYFKLNVNTLSFSNGLGNSIAKIGRFDLDDGSRVGVMDFGFSPAGDSLPLPTVGIGNLGNSPTGFIRVGSQGIPIIDLTANTFGAGSITASTPNGSVNWITSTDEPYGAYILQTNPDLEVVNFMVINPDNKGCIGSHKFNTIEDSPTAANELIVYPNLSGPESTIYDRGTATLVDGEIFVSCPDHFQKLANPASMTVTLTPLSADSKGLAIVEKSNGGFKVKELYGGRGNYSFDYLVMCQRASAADHQVIQQKSDYVPAGQFEKKEFGHKMVNYKQ